MAARAVVSHYLGVTKVVGAVSVVAEAVAALVPAAVADTLAVEVELGQATKLAAAAVQSIMVPLLLMQ
jgi:hypothetical protein